MFQNLINYLLRRKLISFLFFVVVGFVLYSQTIKFNYTDLDDSVLIEDNLSFLEKASNAGKLFTQSVFSVKPEDHDSYYRPILVASFMLDAQLAGKSPMVYHLTNIIIHIIACFLLFIFFLKLYYRIEISFIVALIFLCHPVFTAAVAWIPGRNDSLLAVFVLGAFIKQIDYYKKPTLLNLFSHHLLFLLCLFTKETAILLPLLFFSCIILLSKDKLLNKKTNPLVYDFKRSNSVVFISGWILCIIIYEYFRHNALLNADPINTGEVIDVFEKNTPVIIQYIGKLLFPFHLSTYPIMEDTTYLFGLLSLIIILIFVYLKREKKLRYYWLGLICFILFLLPVASIKENALEHRLYLSAIGFSLMCMESNFINNIRFDKGVGRWIMIFIVLLFSALTIRNSKNYKDEISFWSKALETSPHSAKAHLQMGSYYQIEGKIENAEMEYKTAIELKPDFPNTHNNLGKIYLDKGNLAEAQKFFLQELRIKPNPVAYYNLSSVQEDNGNFEEAKIYLKKSLEMDPNYADALVDLGILNAREQKYDDALDLLQKTIKSDPKNKLAYKNTALVYLAKKQYVKAKEYYLLSKQMGVDLNIPLLDTLVSH